MIRGFPAPRRARPLTISACVSLAALLAASTSRADLVIDNFNNAMGQANFEFSGGHSLENSATGSGIIDGDRKIFGLAGSNDGGYFASINPGSGTLTASIAMGTGSPAGSSYINLIYDGSTGNNAADDTLPPTASGNSLGPVDVTQGGANNAITLSAAAPNVSGIGMDIEFTLFSAGNSASYTLAIPAGATTSTNYTVMLSNFSGVDLTKVTEIAESIFYTTTGSFPGKNTLLSGTVGAESFTFVQPAIAAPEPSTIALALSSAPLGLVLWLRRRKSAA